MAVLVVPREAPPAPQPSPAELAPSACCALAVVSNKGGVGKTTTAVSLAAGLATLGQRTLLVDLDAQASASLSLGFEREDLVPSTYDLLRGRPPAEVIRRRSENLDVIAGSVDLTHVESDFVNLRHRDLQLSARLQAARASYRWIVFDCPPGMGLLTRNALLASDTFLLPVVPQYLAVEGVDGLLAASERLAHRYERVSRPAGLLPTLVDRRTRLTLRALAELRSRYGSLVFDVEVPVNVRLAEAPQAGKTIFEWDDHSSGALAYRVAAVELLARQAGRTGAAIVGLGD
jgi:chromosome partitioning protein